MPLFDDNNYFGFYFDDDFLFLGNRDEQYTGGLGFEYLHIVKKKQAKRNLVNPFSNGQRFFTMCFGTELFTPYNIADSSIIITDRPFSSYMYTSVGYVSFDQRLERRFQAELYLGVMGSPLPGQIQGIIHLFGDSPPTNGWENRLMDEETFIPNIRVHYQRNILTIGKIRPLLFNWFQLSKFFVGHLGYYSDNLGAGFRGQFSSNYPTTESKHTINLKPFDKQYAHAEEKQADWSLYFQGWLELVGRNTSLQSLPWMDSPYTIGRDLVNRHVWTIELGVSLNYKKLFMNYYVRARTKEFRKYTNTWHNWASISIGQRF